jgi:hypothetical protein
MIPSLELNRNVSRQIEALLDATCLPEEENWEGDFKGRTHGGATFDFQLRMSLRIGNGVVEGYGNGLDFPRQVKEPRTFAMTGSVFARTVELQLHFVASYLLRTPFLCFGELSLNRHKVSGAWQLPCFTGCGCITAASGKYELRRIKISGRR